MPLYKECKKMESTTVLWKELIQRQLTACSVWLNGIVIIAAWTKLCYNSVLLQSIVKAGTNRVYFVCVFVFCFLCMLRASLAMPPNAYMQWTSVRCKLMCGAFVVWENFHVHQRPFTGYECGVTHLTILSHCTKRVPPINPTHGMRIIFI